MGRLVRVAVGLLLACGPDDGEYLGSPDGGPLELAPSLGVASDGTLWLTYETSVNPVPSFDAHVVRYSPGGIWERVAPRQDGLERARIAVPEDGQPRVLATGVYPIAGEVWTWGGAGWTDALSFPLSAFDMAAVSMYAAGDGTILAAARHNAERAVTVYRFDGSWQELAGRLDHPTPRELTLTSTGDPVALRGSEVCRWTSQSQWTCLPKPLPELGIAEAAFAIGPGGEWWLATLATYEGSEPGGWLWRSDDHRTWQQVGTPFATDWEGLDLAVTAGGAAVVVTVEPELGAFVVRRWDGERWQLIGRRAHINRAAPVRAPALVVESMGSVVVTWTEPTTEAWQDDPYPDHAEVHLVRFGGATQ